LAIRLNQTRAMSGHVPENVRKCPICAVRLNYKRGNTNVENESNGTFWNIA
jgi:hypothetical protein